MYNSNPAVITASIALMGVLASVIVSYLTNRRMIRTELEKLETGIEQNYASHLVTKRLELYPAVYEPLSNMSKKIRRVLMEPANENINPAEIIHFRQMYDDLNSKHGVVFSSYSSANSKNLRVCLSEIITGFNHDNRNTAVSPATLLLLKERIGDLEFSLKQDLGIYIVEFMDPKRKLHLEKYSDITQLRETPGTAPV